MLYHATFQVRKLNGDVEQHKANTQRFRDLVEYKERQANEFESREKQALQLTHQHLAGLWPMQISCLFTL